jgi:ATP:ADP antiporter, AAA family
MGAVAMPLVLAWIWIARRLGADHRERATATA